MMATIALLEGLRPAPLARLAAIVALALSVGPHVRA